MLVRITNRCRMGCSHCMVEAGPDGDHMSLETFKKVVDLIERHDLMLLMISGGEPLEHPQFFEMIKLARSLPVKMILSNGMFLEDESLRDRVLALDLPVQITNDPRFYPRRVPIIQHPNVMYEDHIRTITALGRAVENDIPNTNRIAPMCFNLRSIVRQFRTFWPAVLQLRTMQKMCSPSINVDGSIVCGEAPSCFKIGTIESSDEELVQNLLSMDCNQCGMESQLEDRYRQAIGLGRRIIVTGF